MLKAVTFDFWNTLYVGPYRRDVLWQRVSRVHKVLAESGYHYTEEEIGSTFKSCWRKAHFYERVEGLEMTPGQHLEYINHQLGLNPDGALFDRLYQAYTEIFLDCPPRLNQGLPKVLQELSPHYQLAVICNTGATPGVVLREVMKREQMDDYFQVLVFSDEVTWAKPNTRIFQHTLAQLGVEPQEAVHVGDDPITDVIGARKMGMKAVWLAPEVRWAVPECNWHIRELRELIDILL